MPVRCELQAVTGSDFGDDMYEDGEAPGPECLCEMDYVQDGTGIPNNHQLWMWVRGEGGSSSVRRPVYAAFAMPWGTPRPDDGPDNLDGSGGARWQAQQFQVFEDPDGLDGTYSFWLSEKRANGSFDDSCDSFEWGGRSGEVQVEIGFNPPGTPPPAEAPARPQSPAGYEDGMDCDANSSATTTFELLEIPHTGVAAPVPVNGSSKHVGADAVTIEVLDWRGADELAIENSTQSVLIEKGDGEVTLPAGDWWIGSIRYHAARKDSPVAWKNPLVQIDHTCPSTPAGNTVSVPTGYGVSLDDLADAVEDATGSAALADILLSAPQSAWPVYAARMVQVERPAPQPDLWFLLLEIRGTYEALAFPVVQTDEDEWSFDYDFAYYSAEGTVSRSGTPLTLSVTSGVLHAPGGDETLSFFDLTVSEL